MNEVPLAGVLSIFFIQLVAIDGLRPKKPGPDDGVAHLTDAIWAIAEQCWVRKPSDRPLAKDICNSLKATVNPCISDSAPPLFGTTCQVLGTLATSEASFLPETKMTPDIHVLKMTPRSDAVEDAPSMRSIQFLQSETDADATLDIQKETMTPGNPMDNTPSARSLEMLQGETSSDPASEVQEEPITPPSNLTDDVPSVTSNKLLQDETNANTGPKLQGKKITPSNPANNAPKVQNAPATLPSNTFIPMPGKGTRYIMYVKFETP